MFWRPDSPATYVEKVRKKYPLNGPDRIGQIYAITARSLPAELTRLVKERVIVIGTIDRNRPDAYTIHLRDGSAIVFTSGMMDFIYAVTRSLVGTFVGHGNEGIEYQQALGIGDVADLVAGLFNQWKAQRRWYTCSKKIDYPRFRLNKDAHRIAETVATNAEAFILCHELAHAMTAHEGGEDTEENADALGLKYFLSAAVQENRYRIPIASAMLVIRIFAGLESVGMHISGEYPPSAERSENLRRTVRTRFATDFDLDKKMTIAVALQDLMDDVDDVIAGVARGSHIDVYRSYVGLLARLEEVMSGKITEEVYTRETQEMAHRIGMCRMHEVANLLARSYPLCPIEDSPQPQRG